MPKLESTKCQYWGEWGHPLEGTQWNGDNICHLPPWPPPPPAFGAVGHRFRRILLPFPLGRESILPFPSLPFVPHPNALPQANPNCVFQNNAPTECSPKKEVKFGEIRQKPMLIESKMDEKDLVDSESAEGKESTGIPAKIDQSLGLSRTNLFLLFSARHFNIRVFWHFSSECTLLDWIGLFQAEEKDPLAFMDYRGFGVCGPKQGAVDWQIRGQMLEEEDRRNNNDKGGTKEIQFRYFDGLSGAVKAASPKVLVFSDAQLAINSLVCQGLHPSRIHQQFYAKLSCSGSSNRVYRTQPSSNGQWTSLNFPFPADCSAELRIRIKAERVWPARGKLIGDANIPVLDLLEGAAAENGRHFSFLLRPQCQQIQLKCRLIPPIRQPLAETMGTLGAAGADSNGNPLAPSSFIVPPSILPNSASSSNSSSSSGCCSSSSTAQMAQSVCSSSSSQFGPNLNANLPPGWEMRIDGQGRIFYIDHIHHKTAWNPPLILERIGDSGFGENEMERTARRTFFGQNGGTNLGEESNGNLGEKASPTEGMDSAKMPNALQFLLRENLFGHLLQGNGEALALYNGSPFLKHILQRIRKEPAKFWQFERNKELIGFVNAFADQTQPLPIGWQMARQCGHQLLFLDHANRRITPFDPRLPEPPRARGCRSAPPVRRKKGQNNGQTRGNQVAMMRQRRRERGEGGAAEGIWGWELAEKADQIQALLAEHCPEMAQRVCAKLRLIGRMGELALLRYANDPDLVRAISLLEELEAKGQLEKEGTGQPKSKFEQTLANFHGALEKAGYGKGPSRIRFRLRRDHLMEDAFQKILGANPMQLRKCQMTVSFSEEEGLDYGGPSRELFFLLSRQLFHPRHGLFEYSSVDSHKVQISPMSKFVDQHLRWMELAGRLLGLALVHRCLLDCFFTRPFYKMLAQIPLDLEDLRDADPQLHHSLCWLHQNPVTADLEMTFSLTEELAGKVMERELVPNGRNLGVTEENKEEFIGRMLHWRAERGVREQCHSLLHGLYAIVDRELLEMFDADQLELALSGSVQIDIADWERNTEYRGGFHANHVVIRWFWLCVQEMRNADRLRLLQFVTGSSSVPFEGFKGLRGSNGPKRFCIEKWGTEESLPRAHTCFNRLDLPAYPNRQRLLAKLMLAITESSVYAIE